MCKKASYFIALLLFLTITDLHAQSNSLEVWIRSFIPDLTHAGAASRNIIINPSGTGSIVEIGSAIVNGTNIARLCFATDNRGFSSDPATSARTDTKFTVTFNPNGTASVSPAAGRTTSGITKRLDCVTGITIEQKAGKIDRDVMGNPAVAGDVIQVIGQVTATDQLVPVAPTILTPSADFSVDLKWNHATTDLTVDLTFGSFPAFEMYARQPGGQWVTVLQQLPVGNAWQLAGDAFGIFSVRKTVTVKIPGLSGKWQSSAPEQRFTLEITGNKVKWTERNAANATLVKEVPITDVGNGKFRVERSNDNEILTFLGFQQSLRNEIIAKNPQPSFIVFYKQGTFITGEWNGLVATKDANAHLKELIQPGVRPPKVFTFSEVQ